MTAGSTYLWKPTFLKDGAVYDLTGATVTVSFFSPVGAVSQFSMTVSGNTATYVNSTTLLTEGQWSRSYRVSVGGVVLESAEIVFQVARSIYGS